MINFESADYKTTKDDNGNLNASVIVINLVFYLLLDCGIL